MKPETPTKAELYQERDLLRVQNAKLSGLVVRLIKWAKSQDLRCANGDCSYCYVCPAEPFCMGLCLFLDYAIAEAWDLGIEVDE